MIHVCFSIQDKTGSYSKFTGTAMLSLFENANPPTALNQPSITVHLLHDNTLTNENREKFIQIANRYDQLLKFYNVEELCVEKFAKINEYFSNVEDSRFSIAMFYRIFIPDLLPYDVEKAIYLDSDIIVNLDISELWQVELADKPLGAVPNLFQMKDEKASNRRTTKIIPSVKEGLIKPEDYFNSGVMLMNLKVLRNEEAKILSGVKFRGEHPELRYYDQEIFNYCFSTSYLRLPVNFNRFVMLARSGNEWIIEKKIYHYAGNKVGLGSNMNDPFNHLWRDYFTRTPWFEVDKLVDLPGGILYPYAISVIIPLYNAEKYLGECIDSILAQTFQDFELIIVDDCSTDSSCEIVESYMPKFNGRLKLFHTEKNTGSGVIARNIGLSKAMGEYIYNMDNDDAIVKTALEEMYSLAKEYDADVVYCERYYMSSGVGEEFIENMYVATNKTQIGPFVDKPTLESRDLSARIQKILDSRFYVAPWSKLVRRDLLERHNITFPVLKISDDDIWTYALVFFAKRWLRVPNMIYIRRMRDDSITGVEKNPQETLRFWLNPILLGLKDLNNFMSQIPFFEGNPQDNYAVLKRFSSGKLSNAFNDAKLLTPADVYEVLISEFGESLGEYDVLISYLCTCIFEQQKEALSNLDQTRQLQENQKLLAEKDAEINRLKAVLAFQTSLLPQANYAISVIIPLYNTAKYVGQCLESLLIQTFQDFEVIVVDDCSTDNSVEIVESYRQKFNGRLRLTKTEKNSGGGGYIPRNIGFKLAHGNYVYFMDADDFLLGSALETFYTTAEKHAVDVIYTATVYDLRKANDAFVRRDSKIPGKTSKLLEGEEVDKFFHELAFENAFTCPWSYFVRREFLLQNNIVFPEIMKAGDYLWAVSICCQTKKIFRLVKPLYFYNRYNVNSVSRRGSASINHSQWIVAFVDFVKALNELAGKIKFLSNNLDYVQGIASRYFKIISKNIAETDKSLSNQEIYERLYYADPSDLMTPFFFSEINDKQKELTNTQAVFRKFRPYIFARVDVKLLSTNGDLKILSLSDNNAELTKPPFINQNGIGYVIQSGAGTLNFIAKATVNGTIQFNLRGLDIRDPNNKSKRIPYWIDYTKLIVNGKFIFDKVMPTWHDKPYRYTLDVKAGEEIKLQIEWLPHRGDVPTVAKTQVKTQVKPSIVDKFLPYLTSRLDVKLLPQGEGDFKIVSVSDDKADVRKPAWMQNDGIGYQIQSCKGNLTLITKVTVDGQIQLNLKGMNVRDPEDKSKRIPYWIDYTKLIVNGKSIFDKVTSTWHDKPYNYMLDVKAGEEIKLQIEWLPHRGDVPTVAKTQVKTQVKPSIVDKFLPYLTSRLDVKLLPQGEGDFKIVSVSDDKADVRKPAWMQNDGIGYQIQSCKGNLTLITKVTVDGQIQLNLKGMNVRDPEDNSKRMPYWIDYTNLEINGQTVFDTLTPTWHDKPYNCMLDVKAGEEITIQTEWLPHSSEAPKPVETEKVEPIVNKFLPSLTSRLDVKLLPQGEGDFKIVSVSDDKADVRKPAWMQNDGIGYQIQSCKGNLTLITKVTADGQIQLNLKGMNVPDPENKSKRLPYWIDYTNLTINGQTIFDTLTPAWHDKPYNYMLDVKAGEEIELQTEWLPHVGDT